MTDDELRRLEEVVAKAAKGPWSTEETVEYCGRFARNSLYLMADERHKAVLYNHLAEDKADAEYIVAACNYLPKLIKMYKEADDEAYEANEAWKKLRVEYLTLRYQVQKLERQAQVLAVAVSEYQRCKTCIVRRSCPNDAKGGPQEDCVVAILKWAEQAAKEAE